MTGRNLTVAASAAALVCVALAVRIFVSGEVRLPSDCSDPAASAKVSAEAALVRAKAAEGAGDTEAAIAAYREAVRSNPRLADRRSPEFLGSAFEAKVRIWTGPAKAGAGPRSARAKDDAAFIFRRMYGGCG